MRCGHTMLSSIRLLLAACLALVSVSAAADLVETIARVKPSVVMVGLYQADGSPQFSLLGTGFVINDGRTIATNAHVVAESEAKIANRPPGGAAIILVVAAAGDLPSEPKARPARVIAIDKTHDLAVLRVDGGGAMPTAVLGDSDKVREGQGIAFTGFPIGNALGFIPVTHRGIVSAITPIVLPTANVQQLKAAAVRRLRDGAFNIFQLDGTAYPGNSGGPLFDAETGEVVGIVNMVVVKRTKEAILSHPSGIGYAIPINYLRALLADGK